MPVSIIIVLVFFLVLAGIGVKSRFSQANDEKPVSSQRISNSSRDTIGRMLKEVERKETPELKMGAMCYDVVGPVEYQEYICPLDGQKTVYSRNDSLAYWFTTTVVEMRRLIERLNSVTNLATFSLDEKSLCHKCSPNLATDERVVTLVTEYPDGTRNRYSRISAEDLQILIGFFGHKLTYDAQRGAEGAVKNEVERIKKILGVGLEKGESKK